MLSLLDTPRLVRTVRAFWAESCPDRDADAGG
jgi:hypothetical protein